MTNDDQHFKLGERLLLEDARGDAVSLGDCVVDVNGSRWTVGGVDAVMTTDRTGVLLSVLLVRSLAPYSARKIPTFHGRIPMHFKA